SPFPRKPLLPTLRSPLTRPRMLLQLNRPSPPSRLLPSTQRPLRSLLRKHPLPTRPRRTKPSRHTSYYEQGPCSSSGALFVNSGCASVVGFHAVPLCRKKELSAEWPGLKEISRPEQWFFLQAARTSTQRPRAAWGRGR